MAKIPIPAFLSHLKVTDKGYPIPYFVAYVDGKPDFRLLDPQKQVRCADMFLCGICGKKLFKKAYYFISGPQGYTNKISTDPAMHRECAEYSLNACPHLHIQKTVRREKGLERLHEEQSDWMADKPETMLLVKCDKYKRIMPDKPGLWLISFRPISYETYVYENGELVKSLMPA